MDLLLRDQAYNARVLPHFTGMEVHVMSEYQYYEFRALDEPLDKRARAALREITSRAEITESSLINEYHWGDFKGNPAKLMERYFDAFVYHANWDTRRLMLRLPAPPFALEEVRPYLLADAFEAWATKTHIILDLNSEEEPGYDDWDEAREGWMASLLPLRADLLAGDRRCLYLGWLAGMR